MEDRTNRLAVRAPRILVLVTIFAALFPLLLQTASATYAQTESSAALDAPVADCGPLGAERGRAQLEFGFRRGQVRVVGVGQRRRLAGIWTTGP